MKHHNSGFNVYRDFAYGCNCNLLATGGVGDRPLTQPGWGQAIDDRDVVCKAYKGFAFDFTKNKNIGYRLYSLLLSIYKLFEYSRQVL